MRFRGERQGVLGMLSVVLMSAIIVLGVSGNVFGAEPVRPQPQEHDLKPGLSVSYLFHKFNSLWELNNWKSVNTPKPGKPLDGLSFPDTPETVLTTDKKMLVGAFIEGMIHLKAAGQYQFIVRSNDGVAVFIGEGRALIVDDGVHPARFSNPAALEITTPGWYALRVEYFQKKGTNALELFWIPPGGTDFVPVPNEVFGYVNVD